MWRSHPKRGVPASGHCARNECRAALRIGPPYLLQRVSMTRHWTINGRFLAQPMTGVQRYAHEIVRRLDAQLAGGHPLARDLDVELLVPPDAARTFPLKAVRRRTVGRVSGHAWEQAVLPFHVRGGLLSFCNTGPLAVGKQILCIHDVNTRAYPQSYSLSFRLLYRTLLPALGLTATTIGTVSHYSAGELARHGICRPGKIVVVPNGHEHATLWTPRHSPATKAVATRDTIVVIGSSIPHKNVGLIIGMADRLAARGLRVAVVGMSDARVFNAANPAAKAHKAGDNVAWLGRVSDDELAALLGDSMCLAFPSFVEGFGLPPLEAMAIGCPVVASDRASLPEICGDAALYASPDDADAWFDAFVRLHDAPDLRSRMIERGHARTAHFRWQDSADGYLAEMARADGVRAELREPVEVAGFIS